MNDDAPHASRLTKANGEPDRRRCTVPNCGHGPKGSGFRFFTRGGYHVCDDHAKKGETK